MNSYDLSRKWFDWSFENPDIIIINEIKNSKPMPLKDYSNGGFYLIKTEFGVYVGKSIDYKHRIKSHLYESSNKILIDKVLKKSKNVDIYLLLKYKDANINFNTREMETIIEQTFISIAFKNNHKVLNERIYGHLQIV